MKKIFMALAVVCGLVGGTSAMAQNLQVHYNLGKHLDSKQEKNPAILLTLEDWRNDKWGQTFYFVDMEHYNNGMNQAYFEIARDLKFWKAPVALHMGYNGGVNQKYKLNNAFIAGVSYLWSGKENNAFTVSMNYRHDQGLERPNNMQLSGVWRWTSWNRLFTLNGHADLRTSHYEGSESGITFVAEPQAWVNLNQYVGVADAFNLSLGTELRLAYNSFYRDTFAFRPTLAVKWTFR